MKAIPSTNQLYFSYPSTARVRIKKENCFYDENRPYVFLIRTKKLEFLIPKVATIFGEKHVFIPLGEYRNALNNLYKSIVK